MTGLTVQLPFVEAITPLLILSVVLIVYGCIVAGVPVEGASFKDQALRIALGMAIILIGIAIVFGLILLHQL